MDFPESFRTLAMNMFLITMRHERRPAEPAFEELLYGIDARARKELCDYLDLILDGRYEDGELEVLWFKTGTDIMFRDMRDTRRFLADVRNELAKQLGRPPR